MTKLCYRLSSLLNTLTNQLMQVQQSRSMYNFLIRFDHKTSDNVITRLILNHKWRKIQVARPFCFYQIISATII